MRARLLGGIGLGAAATLLASTLGGNLTVTIPAGMDLQRVLDSVNEGATLRLGPGVHEGPLLIERSIDLEGTPGARIVSRDDVEPALQVSAPGVSISDLEVQGGWTGIDLIRAPGARISDVAVSGSRSEGIRVYVAPAILERVSISGLASPHAQGIEVLSAPDVVVRDSSVIGGKVGIVAHLSEVVFEDNRVRGTTLAGVVIREMSKGIARGNVVSDATGAGLYCGDMSRCAFEDNRTVNIEPNGSGRSGEGWGLVVNYHASASSHGDELSGAAGEITTLVGSRILDRSPLEPGQGSRAVWPAALAAALAVSVLLIVRRLARPLGARISRGGKRSWVAGTATGILVVGLAVQTFHMAEHFLQLFRVRVDGVPSRGGIVGPVVEPEIIHFGYNAAVLLAIGIVLLARARGWRPTKASGDPWLAAAFALQGYHVIEHSAKLFQHVSEGAKVNPGILGNQVDLVLFHFGINLAVYLGFAIACALYFDVSGWIGRARQTLKARTGVVPTMGE